MGERMHFDQFIAAEKRELLEEGGFTPREQDIFLMRSQKASVIETSIKLHIGEATVKRDSRQIAEKIKRTHMWQRRQSEKARELHRQAE